MGNLNISLEGYAGRVVDLMIREGYAKTKTEALRLALYEFDREHQIVPDEETAFAVVARDIAAQVDSGKLKAKPFSLKEL